MIGPFRIQGILKADPSVEGLKGRKSGETENSDVVTVESSTQFAEAVSESARQSLVYPRFIECQPSWTESKGESREGESDGRIKMRAEASPTIHPLDDRRLVPFAILDIL